MQDYYLFISVLVLTLGSSVRSQCTPKTNTTVTLLTASFNASNTITFDNIGLYDRGGGLGWLDGYDKTRSVSAQVNQTILLSGPNLNTDNLCFLTFGTEERVNIIWNGLVNWAGSTSELPGFYLMAGRGGFCTLYFDPPISAFVARATSDTPPEYSWLEIYDEDAQLMQCARIPNMPGQNTYAEIGFSSPVPIAYVRFVAPGGNTFFTDVIQYETCPEGFVFNTTECIDVDECLEDPCSEHATCSNSIGSYTCTCDEGYEMNNGTCVDIDECATLTPCSEFATCSNTEGSFTCTCEDGFEGTGIGPDGCKEVNIPIFGNSPRPANGPSSSITSSAGIAAHFPKIAVVIFATMLSSF